MTDAFDQLYDPSPTAIPGPAFTEALRVRLRSAAQESMNMNWRTVMPTPTYRSGKICYIEIPATDVEQSAAFYQRAFGWAIRRRGDGATAFDDTVGGVSGIWVTGRPPAAAPGLSVYIMVARLEAAIAAVEAAGGRIVARSGPDEPEVYATFRDPAGNVLGLYQQPGLAETEAEVSGTGS